MLRKGKIVIHHAMVMSMLQYPQIHSYCLCWCVYVRGVVCARVHAHRLCVLSESLVCGYLWCSSSLPHNWPGDKMIMVWVNHSVRTHWDRLCFVKLLLSPTAGSSCRNTQTEVLHVVLMFKKRLHPWCRAVTLILIPLACLESGFFFFFFVNVLIKRSYL